MSLFEVNNKEKTLSNEPASFKFDVLCFFASKLLSPLIVPCPYVVSACVSGLSALLCFKIFRMLFYVFKYFCNALYAFIRFKTLSYTFIRFHMRSYTFICVIRFLNAFIMLLYCFHTLIYAYICFHKLS